MKTDTLTIFGGESWGAYQRKTKILQRILPTYTQKKIRFRVTEWEGKVNITYRDATQESEPVKEFGRVFFNQGAKIKSQEYILTNDNYTEEAIRGFWYDDDGEMYEDDYNMIISNQGCEFEEEFRLVENQYFFTRELGKEVTDITDPYGHLSWVVSDNDEVYENFIAFDYVISDCGGMAFIDSTFNNDRDSCLCRFESTLVPVDEAVQAAKEIVVRAENTLAFFWDVEHQDHNIYRKFELDTTGGDKLIKHLDSEIKS